MVCIPGDCMYLSGDRSYFSSRRVPLNCSGAMYMAVPWLTLVVVRNVLQGSCM